MQLTIHQIDAFTSELFKGNYAAVIPLESWLSDELMLKLKDMYVSAMSSKRTAKDKDLHSLAVSGQWDDDALYNSFASFVESTMYIRRDLMKHLTN